MNKLCSFSIWFSRLVAVSLEDARLLGHQFRETSWTDRMLFEIKRLRDPRFVAITSNERLTGADMDWWFVRKSGGHFCLTVQAKILHYSQQNSALWHYEDLAHPHNSPGAQSRTLVKYARRMRTAKTPVYPYYLFYNPDAVGAPRRYRWPIVGGGVTVADGFLTAAHIALHKGSGRFPIAQKRYSAVEPLMVSLHDLLCTGFRDVPDPEDVAVRVDDIFCDLGGSTGLTRQARRVKPTVGWDLPSYISRLVDGADGRLGDDGRPDDSVPRDTIVFISE